MYMMNAPAVKSAPQVNLMVDLRESGQLGFELFSLVELNIPYDCGAVARQG